MASKYYNINGKMIAHDELLRNKDFKEWLDTFESLTIKAVLKDVESKKEAVTYKFDGGEKIVELLEKKKGGILISAHVGNFEIAEYFFNEIDVDSQINLVTTDNEHRAIKDYLESVSLKNNLKYIIVNEDLSHIRG